MNIENFNELLESAISNVNQIVKEDSFPAYVQVKELLESCKSLDLQKDAELAKKTLAFAIRLMMDAPTKDRDFGLETLQKIDAAYKFVAN